MATTHGNNCPSIKNGPWSILSFLTTKLCTPAVEADYAGQVDHADQAGQTDRRFRRAFRPPNASSTPSFNPLGAASNSPRAVCAHAAASVSRLGIADSSCAWRHASAAAAAECTPCGSAAGSAPGAKGSSPATLVAVLGTRTSHQKQVEGWLHPLRQGWLQARRPRLKPRHLGGGPDGQV